MAKRKRTLRAAAISDLHVGSHWGLCPPDVEMRGGARHRPNPAQAWAWEQFADLARRWGGHRLDALFVLGDCVAGPDKKREGLPNWTNDLELQARTAARCINLWQAPAVYMVHGTPFHVATPGVLVEEWMGELVDNCVPLEDRYAPPHRYADLGHIRFHLCHYIGGSRVWQYRATPKSREMALNLIATGMKEAKFAHVIVRGHVHHYLLVDAGGQIGLTLPCWQLQTDYEGSRNPFGWVPHLGAVRFIVQEGDETPAVQPLIAKIGQWLPQPQQAAEGAGD